MDQLASTSKKAEQVAVINKLSRVVSCLLAYAQGDESALDRALETANTVPEIVKEPAKTAPTEQPQASPFPIESNVPLEGVAVGTRTPNDVKTDDECKCPMAVKDKMSSTHLCMICRKNA